MEEEKVLYHATVCFLLQKNKILLGIKTSGIGKGCWNGYGGGIEKKDKSIKEAAIRELKEETGGLIDDKLGVDAFPKDLEKIAIVYFHNTKTDKEAFVCKVHFYQVRKWIGKPIETNEMIKPMWFDIDSLPFKKMMPADMHWLPFALSGKKIIVKAKLGPFQKELLGDVEIECVKHFDDD